MHAENMRAYCTGLIGTGGSASYSDGTFQWTANSNNGMEAFKFTAGTLSRFRRLKLTLGSKEGETDWSFRVVFVENSTPICTMTYYTPNEEKEIDFSTSSFTESFDEGKSLSDVTSIRFFGGNANSPNASAENPYSVDIDLSTVYLESDKAGISSAEDWDEFAELVTAGFTKVDVEMTNDISVSNGTMIGSSSYPYIGTFDGKGHTLTFTYTDNDKVDIAPFQWAKDATFKDLMTSGSISAKNMIGGLIAYACGNCTLNNCGSTMILSANNGSSDSRVGGLVARCADNVSPAATGITFNYCFYNGNITSSNNQMCGFIGWLRTVTATLNNCFVAATSDVSGGGNTVAATGNDGSVSATNVYYTKKFGSSTQGASATETQLVSGSLAYELNESNTGLLFFGQRNLNVSNVDPLPSLTSDTTKKVLKITPKNCATPLYLNAGGAVPNPVRYGALGFSITDAANPSLAILGSDITESTVLARRYDQYALRVTSARATTLVLPFDADIPDGVKAYDLTFDGSTISASAPLAKITANEPVLINAPQGTYFFTVSNSSEITYSSETVTNGALTGVYVQSNKSGDYNPFIYVPEDGYVLQNGDEGLGFYRVDAANKIRITSFRAYLTAPTSSRYLKIVFPDEDVTSVQGVRDVEENQKETIYLLSGVRTNHPVKGFYIKGGKKFLK